MHHQKKERKTNVWCVCIPRATIQRYKSIFFLFIGNFQFTALTFKIIIIVLYCVEYTWAKTVNEGKKFATLFRIWPLHIQTYTIYIIYIWNRCKRKFTCIVIVCNFQCQPLALSLSLTLFMGLLFIWMNEKKLSLPGLYLIEWFK